MYRSGRREAHRLAMAWILGLVVACNGASSEVVGLDTLGDVRRDTGTTVDGGGATYRHYIYDSLASRQTGTTDPAITVTGKSGNAGGGNGDGSLAIIGTSSPGSSHTHAIDPPTTPGTPALGSQVNIQPRSMRVRYIMRIR